MGADVSGSNVASSPQECLNDYYVLSVTFAVGIGRLSHLSDGGVEFGLYYLLNYYMVHLYKLLDSI